MNPAGFNFQLHTFFIRFLILNVEHSILDIVQPLSLCIKTIENDFSGNAATNS
jgi:hypothetical protein